MANQIVNAAPMVVDRGTQDLSVRQVPREAELIPQHLPKFYLFAQKGPTEPQLVSGVEAERMFGTETFNLRSKYANHSTVFAKLAFGQANSCMIQRVIPDDAGPEANLIAWLDVLPTTVDVYDRNTDGSIKLNNSGDPIITGTTAGYKVKWVVTNRATVVSMQDFGQATVTPGDQTDPLTSTQSQRYPIFETKGSSKGFDGNNAGIRMWAPTVKSVSAMPTKMMTTQYAYPYFISVIRKPDELSSPKIVESIFGEQRTMVTLKQDVVDPLTDKQLYIGDTFISSYENLEDVRYPKLYGDFSDMYVYNDNIELLLTQFHAAEVPHINQFSDFTSSVTQKHLFNILTGVSSYGVPYHSYVFVDAVNSVRFSEYQNVYAAGGSDGTMDNATHASLVSTEVLRYADVNDEVQELAYHAESTIYDTGFPLDTKYDLCSFISQRKDTGVVLGTHTVDGPILTAAEEHSIAIALRTRLQMFPESDYFGTPVMRGIIVGRSGKLRNSQYKKHLPLTAEVLIKAARYMGASHGRWKNGFHFGGAPGSIVENMYDINITWVPASVRNRNWDVGLNWVQSYDRKSFFFPALKTVYDNDTSVLNSFTTMMAICQLNKIAHSAWREFSGVDHLSNAQLEKNVNDFVSAKVKDIFDGKYTIVPDAQHTDMDVIRGFSWTLPIKLYASSMKTVMTTYVQAYRAEDLEQA
jgi:hypothetical protein